MLHCSPPTESSTSRTFFGRRLRTYSHPPEIRGTGYVVDCLEAALWALNRQRDFETVVLAAVNLGDDADTTGAVAGQLAGVHWGLDPIRGIPNRLLEGLAKREMVEEAAERVIAAGWGS